MRLAAFSAASGAWPAEACCLKKPLARHRGLGLLKRAAQGWHGVPKNNQIGALGSSGNARPPPQARPGQVGRVGRVGRQRRVSAPAFYVASTWSTAIARRST
jgi:hypothetical protein